MLRLIKRNSIFLFRLCRTEGRTWKKNEHSQWHSPSFIFLHLMMNFHRSTARLDTLLYTSLLHIALSLADGYPCPKVTSCSDSTFHRFLHKHTKLWTTQHPFIVSWMLTDWQSLIETQENFRSPPQSSNVFNDYDGSYGLHSVDEQNTMQVLM